MQIFGQKNAKKMHFYSKNGTFALLFKIYSSIFARFRLSAEPPEKSRKSNPKTDIQTYIEGFIRIKVLPLFEERHLLLSKKGAAFYRNKFY